MIFEGYTSESETFLAFPRYFEMIDAKPSKSEVPPVNLPLSSATGRHVDKLKLLIQQIQLFTSNRNRKLSHHSIFSDFIHIKFCQAEANNIYSHARLNAVC